jgi:phospholipase/carboxylesterase
MEAFKHEFMIESLDLRHHFYFTDRQPNACGLILQGDLDISSCPGNHLSSMTAAGRIGYASASLAPGGRKARPMLIALSGPTRPPVAGGKPRRLVILLHGLGADGNDLIGLQQVWGRLLPEAEFISPNAPFPCDMAPYGYQWFSAQDRSPPAVLAGVRAAAPMLDAFIDEELEKRGLEEGDTALVGFSQGTMMSLYVGLRRAKPLAGILGYSGRLLAPELLASELRSRPPVLLVHGTEDPLVPFQSLAAAETALKQAGVPVETLACPGVEHAIDQEGLQRGGLFLRQVLSAPPA